MLTVITLLKLKPSPNGQEHGERPFWKEHGERYLEAWIKSVRKYVPDPRCIIVMTDKYEWPTLGYESDVVYTPLDKTVDAPGFWAKLNMFRCGQGKTLYMDLDNVINGPLDELVALEPDPLIMLDDRRVRGLPNGSMILFDAERCRHIWTNYTTTPRYYERTYVADGDDYWMAYDQAFISRNAFANTNKPWLRPSFFQDLLPHGYIMNALSELPHTPDWAKARVIFGCGAEAKPHLSSHPGFSLR